jgi:hypothetical protein
MQLIEVPHTVFRPVPPPLWYVTNGELTVGPVVTGPLMRGVEHQRIPDYCQVRPFRGSWRALSAVREISALQRKPAGVDASEEQLVEWARLIERITDEEELCYNVTWLALLATSAESAMFHYRERNSRTLVTRAIVGPMSNERLEQALPEDDLILKVARRGLPLAGPPYGPNEDALAMRFASSHGGAGAVAMIPLIVGGVLTAMLELSRPGHGFRRSDLQRAERIAQRALRRRGRS